MSVIMLLLLQCDMIRASPSVLFSTWLFLRRVPTRTQPSRRPYPPLISLSILQYSLYRCGATSNPACVIFCKALFQCSDKSTAIRDGGFISSICESCLFCSIGVMLRKPQGTFPIQRVGTILQALKIRAYCSPDLYVALLSLPLWRYL